jgi:hypothetical protein
MSLDLTLSKDVYSCNITHNLNKMAKEAGIYKALWHPEEVGVWRAEDLIPILTPAIADMKNRPEYYKQFNSPNGWGTYDNFIRFLDELLEMCNVFKTAKIEVSI